jgi:hypothetical protein
MSVSELRPTSRTRTQPKPAAKEAAEAEALRAKTATAKAAADLANEIKAAKAAPEIAAAQAKAEEIRRVTAAKERDAEQERQDAAEQRRKAERSAGQWRTWAKTIAVICVLVSLPLQIMAFWSPKAPFLLVAPLVLEGLAWALLKGAEAAIDDHRPSWHYRALAGAVALFAASVNFLHGSQTYGMGTGLGGAFCSLAGPLVWDLHEHGRILRRDHKPTRAQRRATARKAAADAAAKRAAELVAAERLEALETTRAVQWPQVWERAVALAAAVGELHPSEPTWKRAWDDTQGAPLGDTAASIAAKVAAKTAAKDAAKDQATTPAKVEKPQVDSQLPAPARPSARSGVDGRRTNGGTPPRQSASTYPRYSVAARRAMSLAARTRRQQAAAS